MPPKSIFFLFIIFLCIIKKAITLTALLGLNPTRFSKNFYSLIIIPPVNYSIKVSVAYLFLTLSSIVFAAITCDTNVLYNRVTLIRSVNTVSYLGRKLQFMEVILVRERYTPVPHRDCQPPSNLIMVIYIQ